MAVIVCQKNVNSDIGKWSVEDAKKLAIYIASEHLLKLHGPYPAVLEAIKSLENQLEIDGDDETCTIKLDRVGTRHVALCVEIKNNNLQAVRFNNDEISDDNLRNYITSFKRSLFSTQV